METPTIYDGNEKIVFSNSFNVYENQLTIENLLGFTFTFVFEKTEPKEGQNDMTFVGKENTGTVTFSKKIRNNLGSGNTTKFQLVNFENGETLLFTLYSSAIGNDIDAINVTVTFYLKSKQS